MKPTDETLLRLLQAAGRVPAQVASAPPLGLESRVLAQWRAGTTDDDSASLFAFFRRAMVGASLVLALSVAWSLSRPSSTAAGDEASLLNYEIQKSLNP